MTCDPHPEMLEAEILKHLRKFTEPLRTGTLEHLTGQLEDFCYVALRSAARKGLVTMSRGSDNELRWAITAAGRDLVDASEASEAARGDELPCSYAEPATALCHLDEDELDDWWSEQDVEAKAEAFLRFTLGVGSHVDVRYGLTGIPVIGTIRPRHHAQSQPDGHADESAAAK